MQQPQPTVTISGPAQVRLGSTITLSVAVTNTTSTAVSWAVSTIPGGNSTDGTISSVGVYTPPAAIPTSNTVTITTVSVASPAASGSAQLHPNLPDIQTLFNNKNAAFVANVGTLVQPLTRTAYLSGQTAPTNLFSHPDQQLEWQNAAQSAATPTGWAGRMADVLGASYNSGAQIPMVTSVAGDTLYLQWQQQFACFSFTGKPRHLRLL